MNPPKVSRNPSEPKIRPYLRLAIVEAAREVFPNYQGSDADFIEWVLSSLRAGVLGVTNPNNQQSANYAVTQTVTPDLTEQIKTASAKIDLLDDEAD